MTLIQYVMRISIRWKLFVFVAGFNILVAIFLAFSVYKVSYQIFFDNFLKNKLMFARTVGAGIDGGVHASLDSLCDMQKTSYRRWQKYLNHLKQKDSSITYLYTLNYNKADSSFHYCVDADIAKANILWVEAKSFAFEVHIDSLAAPFFMFDQARSESMIKISSREGNFDVTMDRNNGRLTVYVNGMEFAHVVSYSPFQIAVMDKQLTSTERNVETKLVYAGNETPINISISPKGDPFSNPGDFYQDEPEVIDLYRKILATGNDTIDASFKASNYGRCISAYGVVKDESGVPVGLVVVDFYEHELAVLKSSVTRVSTIISIGAILLVLIVLPFLLEMFVIKHIKKLDMGLKLMGDKNFEANISIRSNDEFERLAEGFNLMAQNLNSFYIDLEGKVQERTVTIEQQREELQVQTDNLMQINELLNEQYGILQKQKNKIEEQNIQLASVNREINEQKELVEQSNRQMLSSINYAKRIQSALLQPQMVIDSLLPENFVLYIPRDIVSGDFYYIREVNDIILIIAADCTGHGVPGAFMSMLGISFLNEIVQNCEIGRTDEALNKLRDKVKFSFRQPGVVGDTRDGMDMSFVALNKKTGYVQFSGAYSPFWLIKKHCMNPDVEVELLEIKGDPMPVGVHPKDTNSFTMHELVLEKGDTLYLFSDGYLSQFGGPGYNKFSTKRFREVIKQVYRLPMAEQKVMLGEKLHEWRGYSDQTDDVLVIGVRLS